MDRDEPVAPTNGDVRVEAGEDGAAVVVSEFVGAGAPDPPPARRAGSRQKWTRERVLEAIAEVGGPLGRAPTQNEMIGAGYSSAFQACFASGALGKVEGRAVWADLVTEAGFEPRRRAKLARSEREPQADDGAHSRRGSVSGSASTLGKSAPAPSRSDTHPLKVPGTGLAYQSVEAARSAADEIEADGERVAEQARADGDLGRADLAVDRARELARKIREAAGIRSVDDELAMQEVHEAGAGGPQERHVPGAAGMQETHKRRGGRRPTWTEEAALAKLHDQAVDGVAPARAAFLASGISSAVIVRLFGSYTAMVERAGLTPMLVARHEGRVPDPPIHVLVRPEEMAPFQRSIALATIAGLRAAADVLEAELGAGQAE